MDMAEGDASNNLTSDGFVIPGRIQGSSQTGRLFGRQPGEVGQYSVQYLAILAIGFPQQNGGVRFAVGYDRDEHSYSLGIQNHAQCCVLNKNIATFCTHTTAKIVAAPFWWQLR
jgi:hypothetical protein